MINPFLVYIAAFGATLMVYGLGWATIYPPLSEDLVWFFIWTFVASIFLALVVWPSLGAVRRQPSKLPHWMTWAMVAGMIAEILYTGGIPLMMVAAGVEFDYSQFGIPTFHVVLGTFAPAYAAVRFSDFLLTKRPRYLLAALTPLLFAVLTFSRGAAVIEIITFGFVWLAHHGMPRLRGMIAACVLAVASLYGFGVLGNIRSPGEIEQISQPTMEFSKSAVPSEFLWPYVYMTSPIANFQNTVDANFKPNGSWEQFFSAELIPDFIGKRILESMDVPREDVQRVAPTLNAATIYSRSFSYVGWDGPITMFCALAALVVAFTWAVGRSTYAVPAIAILNTLVFLCVFENMLSFTGMVMQLFWIFVFSKFFPHSPKRHVAASDPRPVKSA